MAIEGNMPIEPGFADWVRSTVKRRLSERKQGSIRQTARRLSVSDTMIGDYLKGESDYPLASLLVVLLAHGLTLADLAKEFTPEHILQALQPRLKTADSPAKTSVKEAALEAVAKMNAIVAEKSAKRGRKST